MPRIKRLALSIMFVALSVGPLAGQASTTNSCSDEEGEIDLSIMIRDTGKVLDLVLVYGHYIARFPEAETSYVTLPDRTYAIKIPKTRLHEALVLKINGEKGRVTFRGKTYSVECAWER